MHRLCARLVRGSAAGPGVRSEKVEGNLEWEAEKHRRARLSGHSLVGP